MSELGLRLLLLANALVPFVFFMAAIYLLLHMAVARFVHNPGSPVLWFFAVVTGPLTRPVRSWFEPGTPEGKVRLVALGVYAALWLASRAFFAWFAGTPQG